VPRSPSPATAPKELVALARREGSRLDERLAQLGAAGITELGIDGPPERPERITYRGPRYYGDVKVDHSEPTRIAAAIDRLADEIRVPDLYVRLRLAAADMALVSTAATQLAQHRHRPGSPEPVGHNPYAPIEPVLEAGIVVVYARNFTGGAALGRRWRPTSEEDRTLHKLLMVARSAVHAHADHTAYRSIVDTTAMLGMMESGPTFGVTHSQMSADTLREIAALCDRQRDRFDAKARALYPLLGRAATS